MDMVTPFGVGGIPDTQTLPKKRDNYNYFFLSLESFFLSLEAGSKMSFIIRAYTVSGVLSLELENVLHKGTVLTLALPVFQR